MTARSGFQPEQAGARIARLRARRDGAGFDEAEAEPHQGRGGGGVLVEAGGEADRIGEAAAEDRLGEDGVVRRGIAAGEVETERA